MAYIDGIIDAIHYLNHDVLWHSPEGSFTQKAPYINDWKLEYVLQLHN